MEYEYECMIIDLEVNLIYCSAIYVQIFYTLLSHLNKYL